MSKLELFREKLDGLVHFYQRAEVNLDEFRGVFHAFRLFKFKIYNTIIFL